VPDNRKSGPQRCGPFLWGRLSERQALEDCLRDLPDGGHDVAPDSWSVEDVGRAAFERPHDVTGNLLGVGKARGVRQVIGHGSLHRSGLDGDDTDAGGMKAAANRVRIAVALTKLTCNSSSRTSTEVSQSFWLCMQP